MKLPSTLATAALVAFVTPQIASAEDVRVTCSGTVAAITGGGVGTAPFAGAQVGEAVIFIVDVEVARQLPFGDYLYSVNEPTCSLAVGAAASGLSGTEAPGVYFKDDSFLYGDLLALDGQVAGGPATYIQLFISDPSGQSWSTGHLETLQGTTLPIAGLESTFQVWSPNGAIEIDLDSIAIDAAPGGVIGTPYCHAEPNTTGLPGETTAYGLETVADNDLTLIATNLPSSAVGYFIASTTQAFVPGAGGSSGNLCLGGSIGRFVGPGQVLTADFGGEVALAVDLTAMPTPTGPTLVNAGETWSFQLWHRQVSPGGPTSNFTRGVAVTFQ